MGEADGDALGNAEVDGASLGLLLGLLVGDFHGERVGLMLTDGSGRALRWRYCWTGG